MFMSASYISVVFIFFIRDIRLKFKADATNDFLDMIW